ncbi:MAG: hypothetical protein JWP75_3065 [Frondihabitans sp.]|nr:hypothetical protein [Frondihabitans sp.]
MTNTLVESDRRTPPGSLPTAMAELARTVLRPALLTTDRNGVTAETIDRFAELGALNHLASASFGGAGLGIDEDRRLHEIVAAGCLNTWLVWAQHAGQAPRIESALDGASPQHELVDGILRGTVLAGAALSDVRHYPERFIAAERTVGGWRFSGTVSWASGWGLNSVLLTAGVDAASAQVVLALLPLGEGVRAEPLDLAAGGGSHTRRVVLDGVEVDDALVIGLTPLDDWTKRDDETAIDAKPALFGLASAILSELRADPVDRVRDLGAAWSSRFHELRSTAYRLADAASAGGPDSGLSERLQTRVDAGEALSTISRALLIARSGRGLRIDDTAQFYLRSAHFLLVQAQTATVRAGQLGALAPKG